MNTPREHQHTSENRILADLPRAEYERLRPHLETVRLAQGRILYNAGDTVGHAYFPKAGLLSILYTTEDGRTFEVAMVGSEGVAGIPVVLRAPTALYHLVVQLPADALRIRGDLLREEFNRGGKLHDLMLRYMHALLTQIAQSAACARFHTVEERLCRLLLISRDRARTDALPFTQEFLSQMLGAPRTSVTMIASALQQRGVIRSRRGMITILDGARLEGFSCECYRIVRDELAHFITA